MHPPSASLTPSWHGGKDPLGDGVGPTHSPMPRKAWPALQHPFSHHDFILQQSLWQLASRIQCHAALVLPVCNIQPKEAGWRGGQSSPWGKVWWSRKGPGERRAPFSPKSSNPWLNRELFPKPHGNRAVLQIWLEMFTPRAGKCWRRNPYPRKGRTAFSVQSLFSGAVLQNAAINSPQ